MARLLRLESDEAKRKLLAERLTWGANESTIITSSVEDAQALIEAGRVDTLRTNFYNPKIHLGQGRLYSRPAIDSALKKGVKVEIVTDIPDILKMQIEAMGFPELLDKVSFVESEITITKPPPAERA